MRRIAASGLSYLELVTWLLRRIRLADGGAGVWEAADLQWWWRTPRETDHIGQAFWLDDRGPVAALLLTQWGRRWDLDPILSPELGDGERDRVWEEGLAWLDSFSRERVEVLAREDDPALTDRLIGAGFAPTGEGGAEAWMDAGDRPPMPALPDGYRLVDRTQTLARPHHMIGRSGPEVEARLRQTSMYDPQLDLAVEAPDGEIAGYGMFWRDPVTRVGMVEPMRTEDRHQRRGLARAVLAAGLERLAARGARRLKISYESPVARDLYLSSGFRTASTSRTYARDRS